MQFGWCDKKIILFSPIFHPSSQSLFLLIFSHDVITHRSWLVDCVGARKKIYGNKLAFAYFMSSYWWHTVRLGRVNWLTIYQQHRTISPVFHEAKKLYKCDEPSFSLIWFQIWMSHWCHTMIYGAKFWISCQRLKILRKGSHWQLIQN